MDEDKIKVLRILPDTEPEIITIAFNAGGYADALNCTPWKINGRIPAFSNGVYEMCGSDSSRKIFLGLRGFTLTGFKMRFYNEVIKNL